MSTDTAREDWTRRYFESTRDGKSALRVFTVVTTSVTDDEATVLGAAGLPVHSEAHPADAFTFVSSRRANKIAPTFWEVFVRYKTTDGSVGTRDNPLDRPTDVNWEQSATIEPIDTTLEDNPRPIVNKAGQSFDPPITREFIDPVVVLTRNQSTFDPATIVNYVNHVNADTFMGQAAGRARMISIRATKIIDDAFEFWRASYRIQFRKELPQQGASKAWYRRVLNAGTMKLVDNKLVNIIDKKSNQPVTSPVPLKADGSDQIGSGEQATWIDFEIYPSVAFAPLGLG